MAGNPINPKTTLLPAILYLSRSGFVFASPKVSGVLNFPFPTEMVKDLALVPGKKADLIGQIRAVREKVKIPASRIIVLLDETVYFERDLPSSSPEIMQTDVDKFLASVPFESTISRTYRLPKSTKVVAIDRDIFEAVVIPWQVESEIAAVVPLGLTDLKFQGNNISPQLAAQILSRLESLKSLSLLDRAAPTQTAQSPQSQKLQLAALLGIFVILAVLLVVLLKTMGVIGAKPPVRQPNALGTAPRTTVSPGPVLATSNGLAGLSVLLVTDGQKPALVQSLERVLDSDGLKDIKIATAPAAPVPEIAFESSLSAQIQKAVIDSLSGLVPGLTARTTSSGQFNITITLSHS